MYVLKKSDLPLKNAHPEGDTVKFSFDSILDTFTTVINGTVLEFDAEGKAKYNDLTICRSLTNNDRELLCRIKITNTSSRTVNLPDVTVLRCAEPDLGIPFEKIKIFKLARQKSDVPGVFFPAVKDENYLDAAFDSTEIAAGFGVSAVDSDDTANTDFIEADPAMVFITPEPLFTGFSSQNNHLSSVKITIDHTSQQITTFSATAELDSRQLAPGECFYCNDFIVEKGSSLQQLLKNHAERVAEICGTRHLPFDNVYCTWYYYGNNINRQEILDNLEHISANSLPFQVFQLDNGWHNGFGTWDVDLEKFPGGMVEIAQKIRDAGMCPGIWTAPFVMQQDSEAVKLYPDIVLRDEQGEPCLFKTSYGMCFILDPFAVNAEKYITDLFHKLISWGYTYHKLDFLRAVFNNKNARFARPATRAEAYRRGMQLIRNAVGDNCSVNACGGLFEGSAGLAEVVRSGADLRGHWHGGDAGRIANYTMRMKQNIWRNFYNKLWSVDPDALQLRRNDVVWQNTKKHLCCANFTDDEAFSITVNQFLGGGIYCVSERFKTFDADREQLLRFLLELRNGVPEIIGGIDGYMPEIFYSGKNRHLLCICNWNGDESKKFTISVDLLPPDVSGSVTDIYSGDKAGFIDRTSPFTVELPPHASAIYCIG